MSEGCKKYFLGKKKNNSIINFHDYYNLKTLDCEMIQYDAQQYEHGKNWIEFYVHRFCRILIK